MLNADEFLKEIAGQVDPVEMFRSVVGEPDDWQRELLQWPNGVDHPADDPVLLALCSRNTGKSQTIAIKALHFMETHPGQTVVILAPSLRQSQNQYRYIRLAQDKLPLLSPTAKETESEMHFSNRSRVVVLPGATPDNVRSYRAGLVLLEEAARLSDELIQAAIPMLTEDGKILAVSTPAGQTGWFFDTFTQTDTTRLVARSTEILRLERIWQRDKKIMTKSAFDCEHLLRWQSSGDNFFDADVVSVAFSDAVEPLALPWL